jgi:uncharacterized protein (DUF983 family)
MSESPPTPARAAFRGLCPRCGASTLFDGAVRFATTCRSCGLDFAAFNVGDGPAAFLVLIVGALVTALAIAVELTAGPPWWLHLLLWPPVALVLVLVMLRLAKAALLALEFRNSAREGRLRNS